MMVLFKKMTGVLTLAALLCCTATSVLALSYNTLYVADRNTNLYTVDSATGTADFVGGIGVEEITDIAFSGSSLFMITFTSLYSIDLVTGAGSLIRDFESNLRFMNSLAADDNGLLYAAGALGDLVTIDPDTAAITRIGKYGPGIGGSGDLEFIDGTLYASVYYRSDDSVDYLATVDTDSGAATPYENGLGFPLVMGLGYQDGTLFGQTVTNDLEGAEPGKLLKIDPSTGLAAEIGPIIETSTNRPVNPLGMSVSPMEPAPVPEPATILLLCSGLGALGLTRFGRRSRK